MSYRSVSSRGWLFLDGLAAFSLTHAKDCNDNGRPDAQDVGSEDIFDLDTFRAFDGADGGRAGARADCGLEPTLELAVASPTESLVEIFQPRLEGFYRRSVRLESAHPPSDLLAFDVDGDGLPDVVALSAAPGSLDVWLGEGDLRFGSELVIPLRANSELVELSAVRVDSDDLNENGMLDEREPDCDQNFLPDEYEISEIPALDENADGIIDECESKEHFVVSLEPGRPLPASPENLPQASVGVWLHSLGFEDDSSGVRGWNITVTTTGACRFVGLDRRDSAMREIGGPLQPDGFYLWEVAEVEDDAVVHWITSVTILALASSSFLPPSKSPHLLLSSVPERRCPTEPGPLRVWPR